MVLSLPHLAHNKRSLASNLVPLRQLLKEYNDVRTAAEDDEGGAANVAVEAALEKLRELCVEVAAKDAAKDAAVSAHLKDVRFPNSLLLPNVREGGGGQEHLLPFVQLLQGQVPCCIDAND